MASKHTTKVRAFSLFNVEKTLFYSLSSFFFSLLLSIKDENIFLCGGAYRPKEEGRRSQFQIKKVHFNFRRSINRQEEYKPGQ